MVVDERENSGLVRRDQRPHARSLRLDGQETPPPAADKVRDADHTHAVLHRLVVPHLLLGEELPHRVLDPAFRSHSSARAARSEKTPTAEPAPPPRWKVLSCWPRTSPAPHWSSRNTRCGSRYLRGELNWQDVTGHQPLHNPDGRAGQLSLSYAESSFHTRGRNDCQIPGTSSRDIAVQSIRRSFNHTKPVVTLLTSWWWWKMKLAYRSSCSEGLRLPVL